MIGCEALSTEPEQNLTVSAEPGFTGSIGVAELATLAVRVTRSDGQAVGGVETVWSSSDPDVASVPRRTDGSGPLGARLNGLSVGEATLTVTVDHPDLTGSVTLPT